MKRTRSLIGSYGERWKEAYGNIKRDVFEAGWDEESRAYFFFVEYWHKFGLCRFSGDEDENCENCIAYQEGLCHKYMDYGYQMWFCDGPQLTFKIYDAVREGNILKTRFLIWKMVKKVNRIIRKQNRACNIEFHQKIMNSVHELNQGDEEK